MRRRIRYRAVGQVLVLATACALAAGADRVTLDKPVAISTVKADKRPLDGRVVAYDENGFELVQGKNKIVTVRWDELGPPGQYNVRSALLGQKATGEQWVELGQKMLQLEGGEPFADRAFSRALRLDPKLKAKVEEAKQTKPQAAVREKGGDDKGDKSETDANASADTMAGPQVVGRVDERAWGKLTDEEQAAEVERLRAFAEAAGKRIGRSLVLHETRYFLFYSDLSPRDAANWAGLLDRMYARLAELFGVKKEEGDSHAYANVWYGKALVFVFQSADDYRQFQVRVHQTDPASSAGMCHCFGDGKVHIAFYRQPNDFSFAHVLVHESVHGFVHRYKGPATVPSWANEGLAEVIADELVPQPGRLKEREAMAKNALQQFGGMGGMLDAGHISGWQYPVAETLCAFMIRQSKRNYVDFIVGIKQGLSWEESLKQRYKAPRDRLVRAYGESLNLKGLKE